MERGHYGQYTGNAKHSRKEEMIHDRELIYDAKKQLHRADQDYKSDSPAKKALVGNQNKLPGHLKQAISDAPGKMYGKKKGAAAYMSDELTDMPLDKDMTGGRSAAMMYGKDDSALSNNGRKKVVTLAEQNFRSERRMPGFAEDTSSNAERFKSKGTSSTKKPKPKADPKIKKAPAKNMGKVLKGKLRK